MWPWWERNRRTWSLLRFPPKDCKEKDVELRLLFSPNMIPELDTLPSSWHFRDGFEGLGKVYGDERVRGGKEDMIIAV